MTTTWTAVFEADAYRTEWREFPDELTPPEGRRLLDSVARALRPHGWDFGEFFQEDYGWHAEALASDGTKSTGVSLVMAPSEGDESSADHGWRVVIGANMGLFAGTKRRRHALLLKLANDVTNVIGVISGRDVNWQSGPLRDASPLR